MASDQAFPSTSNVFSLDDLISVVKQGEAVARGTAALL